MPDNCFDLNSPLQCNDLDPDMFSRCGQDLNHVGVHENWYGTWYGGVWFTKAVA